MDQKQMETVANWILPGLTLYYRDSVLSVDQMAQYQVGRVMRSPTFVDVSSIAGGVAGNTRFIFASSHAAPLFRLDPSTEKYRLHTIAAESYFKVIDNHFEAQTKDRQIVLLHIPSTAAATMENVEINLGEQTLREFLIQRTRQSLSEKLNTPTPPALLEKEWRERINFPIGLDPEDKPFPLQPERPLPPPVLPLYTAIKKMTEDEGKLNRLLA